MSKRSNLERGAEHTVQQFEARRPARRKRDRLEQLMDELGTASVAETCRIAGHGVDKCYSLIKRREYVSFLDDGSRRITLKSIKERQERLLAAQQSFQRAPWTHGIADRKKAGSAA